MSLKSLWWNVLKVTIITSIIVCQGFILNNQLDSDYLDNSIEESMKIPATDIELAPNGTGELISSISSFTIIQNITIEIKTKNNISSKIKTIVTVPDDILTQEIISKEGIIFDKSTEQSKNTTATDKHIISPLELEFSNDLCVLDIVNGKITEAFYRIDNLPNITSVTHQQLPSIIPEIVKKAYNYNHRFYSNYRVNNPDERVDPDHRVAYIVEFIQRQPSVSGGTAGLDALFTEMKANNHLNSLRVLILGYAINQSSADPAELSPLKDKIKSYENNMIDLFVDDFRHHKRNPELSHFQLLNNGDYFQYYIKQIINQTLSQDKPETIKRLKNIIYSIHNFPYFGQTAEGLSVVCDYIISEELQETPVTIKLAYMVNYYMTRPNYQRLSYELRNQFQSINAKFPNDVVDFITKPNSCKLINKEHGEYLYADDAYDEARRHAYLWREPQNDMVLGSKWKFETPNMGDTFTIKNVHYSEDLYAAADLFAYDGSRRSVFTWIPGTAGDPEEQWVIIPRNGPFFVLKNLRRNEYLYGDSEIVKDKDRRYAFTWRNETLDADKLQESLWEIKC